jgi:hypothetical protein
MGIIDRYIYAVTKRLPESQREDIEKELRSIIEDMMEQYDGEPNEAKVQKVLLELGDPALLADNYRGSKRYLIGPDNYNNYITVMKIVFMAIFIGVSVGVVVENIFSFDSNIPKIIAEYMATLFSALMQGFAWVTVSFAIAEYYGVKELNKANEKKQWDLSQLPQIPVKKAVISKWDLVFTIIFSTIFIIIICFMPKLFAAYIQSSDGIRIIPVFNIEVLLEYRVLFIITFMLGILREVLKFISGRWTLKLAVANSAISIISMVLALIIFSNPNIWNQSFATEIASSITDSNIKFITIWNNIKNSVLVIIVVATVIEVISNMYKGIKYNTGR